MAVRPGGLDPTEVNQALQILAAADSIDDLERIVDELPIIREPFLHAVLRQEYFRLKNQHSPQLENFANLYHTLFILLHFKTHQELCDAVKPAIAKPFKQSLIFAPPFFSELARILEDKLPVHQGMPLHPLRDNVQIQQAVSAAIGRNISLPPYEPTNGSYWSAVIVGCPACSQRWLAWRAYAVDLLLAQELIQPSQDGQVNNAVCPYCGEVMCYPEAVWIQDGPGSGDALAAISCIWRLTASVFAYQPPPGTPRVEKNDYILEIRCGQLKESIDWLELGSTAPEEQTKMISMSIAYTIDELWMRLQQAVDNEGCSRETLVEDISRKIQSGLLPVSQAEVFIRDIVAKVGSDWQLTYPDYQTSGDTGYLIRDLVDWLIAEGIADAQDRPAGVRAMLAAGTVQAWLALGETGLAEATLARAEDLMYAIPKDDPQSTLFKTAINIARAEVYDRIRSPEEADRQRNMAKSFLEEYDTLAARFAAQQMISSHALMLYETHHFADALNEHSQCVDALKSMLNEALTSQNSTERNLVPAIQQTLSGTLANWAAVLTDLGEYLDTYIKFSASPAMRSSLLENSMEPFVATEYVEAALPTLEHMFPGVHPNALMDMTQKLLNMAQKLLREALELSESVRSWEIAGIQAHRLAALLDKSGSFDDAETFCKKAITYSARVGDHRRVWTAYCYLADHAMIRKDGKAALSHIEKSAREWIREKVGLGFHTAFGSDIQIIGNAALETVAMGADAVSAVAVVESLKAATTAASLARGMPLQPMAGDEKSLAGHLQELVQKREQLRMQLIGNPNDPTLMTQFQQIQEEVQQERQDLSLRDPRFGQWVDATDIDLTDSKALMDNIAHFGPKTTLLSMLVVQDQVWICMVWDGGSIVCRQPMPSWGTPDESDQGRDSVDRNLLPLEQGDVGVRTIEPWDSFYLARLAETILTPLEKRLDELKPDDRLIISASGELNQVPFSALPYHGVPLCKHVTLSFIQSIGVLEVCISRPARDFNSVLCLVGTSRPDMRNLPGALAEVRGIASLFESVGKKSRLFIGAQATVSAFKSNAGDSDVVHIACHAMAADSPDGMSSLMLAPDSHEADSGNLTEDRIPLEILLLPGCFVNLAGCSTGTQIESDTPLLGGLIPAFMIAGAVSVLGSLWPIQDLAAVKFQTEFYRQLLAGNSPAISLSKTQRECFDGTRGEEMQPPSVWAGYVVYGAM